MKRRLKVWGGLTMTERGQRRTVIATTSQRVAAEKLGCSLHEFRQYWTETGNLNETRAALSSPGVIFRAVGTAFDSKYEPSF